MKKLLLLIALLLPALFVTAQGIKNGLKEEPKINVGIKGGFNSSMYFSSQLLIVKRQREELQVFKVLSHLRNDCSKPIFVQQNKKVSCSKTFLPSPLYGLKSVHRDPPPKFGW